MFKNASTHHAFWLFYGSAFSTETLTLTTNQMLQPSGYKHWNAFWNEILYLFRVMYTQLKILPPPSVTRSVLMVAHMFWFKNDALIITDLILDQQIESPPHPVLCSSPWLQHLSHSPDTVKMHQIPTLQWNLRHRGQLNLIMQDDHQLIHLTQLSVNASSYSEPPLKHHNALEAQRKDRTGDVCVHVYKSMSG